MEKTIEDLKKDFECPEFKKQIKEHLVITDMILRNAMILNKDEKYIKLVNPEYTGYLGETGIAIRRSGIRAKKGHYGIWEITINNKKLIFTSKRGAKIHVTLAHHLERYNRDNLGQNHRNPNAIGTYLAENNILTIKDFVDHGGTIKLLEQYEDHTVNKRRERELINQLMLEHEVNGKNDKIWNQRRG